LIDYGYIPVTIFKSIAQTQALLQQLSTTLQNNDDGHVLQSISKELDKITLFAQKLTGEKPLSSTNTKLEIKSGCYLFPDEKSFFCPHCYDKTGNKVPTKRLNSKLRVCPACRTSLS